MALKSPTENTKDWLVRGNLKTAYGRNPCFFFIFLSDISRSADAIKAFNLEGPDQFTQQSEGEGGLEMFFDGKKMWPTIEKLSLTENKRVLFCKEPCKKDKLGYILALQSTYYNLGISGENLIKNAHSLN